MQQRCTDSILKTERRPRRAVVGVPDDIPPGGRRIVQVAGREIGIFHLDGEFLALLNVCPHRGAPLCTGRMRPSVEMGEPEFVYSETNEVLKCPWHQWEFDIRTGKALHGDSAVRTYRVAVEGSELVVYI
ncbi:MAG: Rieske (2Fe-2S) protein [Caldilineaceae bacterium SB0665_bin_21]|nr:Rieske (2Fe-2S) protein [Caldilineaceae bacterium SB0665_bin_21]MYA03267.1 Rieske (2Fe-2S) protein [Caldilineaceae bacterium SB0664_bin_22]MYC63232.1 Rieske (2Fe-2S) protein [Caldilineaceae bacterium SB0661_bin_34]